jgi:hypothetical protein
MTVKVTSLCDYRRSREEEKRSKNGNVLDILRQASVPWESYFKLDEEEEEE